MYAETMIRTEQAGQVLKHLLPDFEVSSKVETRQDGPESFADLLAKGIGSAVELHQVMLAATKAQIAMELLIEIRNKLIEAYKQVSQMPV